MTKIVFEDMFKGPIKWFSIETPLKSEPEKASCVMRIVGASSQWGVNSDVVNKVSHIFSTLEPCLKDDAKNLILYNNGNVENEKVDIGITYEGPLANLFGTDVIDIWTTMLEPGYSNRMLGAYSEMKRLFNGESTSSDVLDYYGLELK